MAKSLPGRKRVKIIAYPANIFDKQDIRRAGTSKDNSCLFNKDSST